MSLSLTIFSDLHSELSLIRRKSFNKRPSDLDVKQNVSNSPTTATPMSVPPESPAKDISSPISNGIINGTSSTLPGTISSASSKFFPFFLSLTYVFLSFFCR